MTAIDKEPQLREARAEPAVRCPVQHTGAPRKKSVRPAGGAGRSGAPVGRSRRGAWHVRGFAEARAILRSGDTRQAGFKAELVTAGSALTNVPILYQHGKAHQEQRTKTARFFTPRTVSTNYRQLMETFSGRLVAAIRKAGRADLSKLSMTLAVQVAAQVVGLTSSTVPGLDRRLEAFFNQAGVARRAGIVSRLAELTNMRRLLLFYWLDVRPAIRARRQQPREDVISHLLAQGYNDREILTECVTYAAAGMATTREFISIAAWHFLEHPELRARYMAAPEEERVAILHEILRVEPVVSHLYRRATADIALQTGGREIVIPEGALIDVSIDAANLDETVVGAEPAAICPGRALNAERAGAMLLSFGDGAHRCPGAYLAIQESDIFLRRLLALPGLRIVRPPALTWNTVTAGYELRKFIIAVGAGGPSGSGAQ